MGRTFFEFWKTLPGILTGTAAVIGAVVSLVVVLTDGEGSPPPATQVPTPTASALPSLGPTGSSTAGVTAPPPSDPTSTPVIVVAVRAPDTQTGETQPSPIGESVAPTPIPTATQAPVFLGLAAQPTGSGSIDVVPPPNQDGGYRSGTNVLLTALPNGGFEFTTWAGEAAGSINPLSFNIETSMSVTAVFSALPTPTPTRTPAPTPTPTGTATPAPVFLSISGQPSGGGTVDVVPPPNQGGGYRLGTSVLLTASPSAGFEFTSWTGSASGSINPLSINMSSDMSVTAVFSAVPTPTPTPPPTPTPTPTATATPAPVFLTTSAQPSAGGAVGVVPPSQDGGYPPGTTVLLTAVSSAGFEFISWAGGASGSINPLSFDIDSSISVTAVFSALPTPTPTPVPTATPTPTATPIPAPAFDPSPNQFNPKIGTGGDTITLFGNNFDGPNLDVTFGGVSADVESFTKTRIMAIVPSGVSGATQISVSTDGGTAISVDNFTIF